MSFWAGVKLFFQFLPEIISLLKWAREALKEGYTEIQVKKVLNATSKALSIKDTDERNRALNAAWDD